ncbi:MULTISPECIES: Nif11-like leader peptide family natural product precursor [unclassified Synechococcus]|uniref:Nif11-like leader peptide family natural product precursor n=1 Tax=unclassified Synechococcus TaxID=2626047 RepID=UPI00140A148E|nr:MULTISPECIES: Nif11-like leader peptide family natural product precursor [unclassified Synechococcus]
MSREALQDFLRAIEHHQGLRRDAARCSDDIELLTLAQRHGFDVIQRDLSDDAQESAITRWFETSRIQRSFQSTPSQSTQSQSPQS